MIETLETLGYLFLLIIATIFCGSIGFFSVLLISIFAQYRKRRNKKIDQVQAYILSELKKHRSQDELR